MYGRLYLLWSPVSSIVWNVDINNYGFYCMSYVTYVL